LLFIVATVLLLQLVPPLRIASAQEMIPAAGGSLTLPAIGDPAYCVEEPRPVEELEAVIGASVPATPAFFTTVTGEPADQATISAITATMIEVSACNNAGDFWRLGSLYTEAGNAEDLPGITAEEIAFIVAPPVPAPADETYVIFDITGVQTLPDGRVGAIVLFGPGGSEGADYLIFKQVGDRYLIDLWVDEPFDLLSESEVTASATPTP